MLKTPVLFLIFNRPQLTAKVFEAIRQARPQQLFIAADGPCTDRNEQEICLETRAIATKVDWPCQVHTLFRDTNLGCGKAVSGAINWFFEKVDQGIILEDDCLPDQSFFRFCSDLLDQYADTPEVMSISGSNLLPNGWKSQNQSYQFGHVGIWGWATWKRAWRLFDYDMADWQEQQQRDKVKNAMANLNWYNYYVGMMEAAYKGVLDTWDIQWFYCILSHGAFSINPSVNLVKNIGFGADATHTFEKDSIYANLLQHEIKFPLKHPAKLKIDKQYLRHSFRRVVLHDKTLKECIKFWIRLYLNKIRKLSYS